MKYTVIQYELCDQVVQKDNNELIGIIRPFGDEFLAYVKDRGQIAKNGFDTFESKEVASDRIIKIYESENGIAGDTFVIYKDENRLY